MNKIPAIVTNIESNDILNIVSFGFENYNLAMMCLEVGNLHVNDKVVLSVKPSSVAIGKDFNGSLSYSNQLVGQIKKVDMGDLLCALYVDVKGVIIKSIITKKSALRMNLTCEDNVTCIIKASNLSILEVVK